MSVNKVKNLRPSQLQRLLEIDDKSLEHMIQELHNSRIIKYKYNFKCPECEEACTAYERKIDFENYICNECGKELNKEEVKKLVHSILYDIDREELIKYQQDSEVDFIKASFDSDKVVNINEIMPTIEGEKKKMKIFIGSSKEAVADMNQIARLIENTGHTPLPWNAKGQGLFLAGQFTLDNLIKVTDKVDAAIFMFNGEDETWYRDKAEPVQAVRDNVLLEYGLFIGKKGKEKVTFICKNKPKIATDLLGMTYIDGDQGEYNLTPDLNDWLKSVE